MQLLEQDEMWRRHEEISGRRSGSRRSRSRDHSYERPRRNVRRAHMDRPEDERNPMDGDWAPPSTHWTRQLQKAEEADPGRYDCSLKKKKITS